MFEDIDLKISEEKKEEATSQQGWSIGTYCTRTGCWGTSCKWPC
jgi:hypothetical protein